MRVPAGVHLVARGHVGHAGHPHVDGLGADARRIGQRDALLLQLDPQARQLHSTHTLRLAASADHRTCALKQMLHFKRNAHSFMCLRRHLAHPLLVTVVGRAPWEPQDTQGHQAGKASLFGQFNEAAPMHAVTLSGMLRRGAQRKHSKSPAPRRACRSGPAAAPSGRPCSWRCRAPTPCCLGC